MLDYEQASVEDFDTRLHLAWSEHSPHEVSIWSADGLRRLAVLEVEGIAGPVTAARVMYGLIADPAKGYGADCRPKLWERGG